MKGYKFVIGGDPAMARNTVYATLENQGFALTHIDDWSADAERGSSGASVIFGAFAGKKGRHVSKAAGLVPISPGRNCDYAHAGNQRRFGRAYWCKTGFRSLLRYLQCCKFNFPKRRCVDIERQSIM